MNEIHDAILKAANACGQRRSREAGGCFSNTHFCHENHCKCMADCIHDSAFAIITFLRELWMDERHKNVDDYDILADKIENEARNMIND